MLDTRYVVNYKVTMRSKSLLRIGDEEGILLDAYSKKPIIPATSFAGAIHNFLYSYIDDDELINLFGDVQSSLKSRIIISDSVMTGKYNQEIEKRDRVSIDGKHGVAEKTGKYEITAIPAGQCFEIDFSLELSKNQDKEKYDIIILQVIKAIDLGIIRFGAQKSSGAGIFKIMKVERCVLDLFDIENYANYILGNYKYLDVISRLDNVELPTSMTVISFEADTETPIIVIGKAMHDHNEADNIAIKNAAGEYIIPGSSLKGLLRCHVGRIAEYIGLSEEIDENMFGSKKNNRINMTKSNVLFSDCIIENANDHVIYHHNKIDKLTGGVMNEALFSERPITGHIKETVVLSNINDDKKNAFIGLLILAINDILTGKVSIGSGFSIGYGHFSGRTIEIMEGSEALSIEVGNIKSNKYIEAVKGLREATNEN